MATNETALVAQVAKAIQREHPTAWVFKVHGDPYQMQGVPDLLCCVAGHFVGLEVKHRKPGESEQHARGRATAGQIAQIENIRSAQGTAAVVLSPQEALYTIASVLK